MNIRTKLRFAAVLLTLMAVACLSQAAFAQTRTTTTDATTTPQICILASCPALQGVVSTSLARHDVGALAISFEVDEEEGLVANVLTQDIEALEALGSSSSPSGSGGAGKVKFERLSIRRSTQVTSLALARLPVVFPEGLTVMTASGEQMTSDDFLDLSSPDGGPQAIDKSSPMLWDGIVSGGPAYECWWVDGELVCWCPGGGSC